MKSKSIAQLLTGLLVVVVGVGFLLDGLNVFDFSYYIRDFWPLAIIAVGLVSFIANPRVFVWPLAITGFGFLLLLRQLEVVNFNVWGLIWPVAIILVGFSLIFERTGGWGLGKQNEVSEDSVDLFALFSGHNTRNVSPKFKGGSITAMFGGVDLDLRGASIDKQATINVFAAFGGIDLKVPDGWVIKVSGAPIFGGWEDKTHAPKDTKNAPVLNIHGTCLFGGVDIKN